jgi:hypothetical protein
MRITQRLISGLLAAVSCTAYLPTCGARTIAGVQETLYFGTSRPGGVITLPQWRTFGDEVISVNVPQRSTVAPAEGSAAS